MQTLVTSQAFAHGVADGCRHITRGRFQCSRARVGGSQYCKSHKNLAERETKKAKLKAATALEGYIHFPGSKCTNIYFIRAESGAVKIGYADIVQNRLVTIQTYFPERLTLLAHFVAPKVMEKKLHEALKEHRLTGEWFAWCPEIEILCRLARAGQIDNIKQFVGWPKPLYE